MRVRVVTNLEVLSTVSVKQMTLELVLSETLLTDRTEVVRLVSLPDKEVGVGLEVIRPALSHGPGRGGIDDRQPGSLHSDPRHVWKCPELQHQY